MTEKKVLIFYGTRYGATEGVAGRMAELIRENGNQAEVLDLKDLPNDRIPDFSNYDGILIGSSIRIGQWTKGVKKFIENKAEALNQFKGKKGFYVCSAYAADPDNYERVKVEYTIDGCQKYGIKELDLYDAFGGLMDFTETSRMGWLEKKLLKVAAKQASGEKTENDSYTDLRDWDQIEKFTLEFIKKL
ncbi:MAG: flavodoxin domain-containing protein [Candidatus Heimdallarchaeaceae archaeon]